MLALSRRVLCLDWNKRSLRIVVARVGKTRPVLEDAHSVNLPNTVDADDPETMGDYIRSVLRRYRLRFKTVAVDVTRERAVINRLTLPPTPAVEVAAAVRFQAMKELPFPIDTAAVDFVVTRRDEKGLATEVLLAAVPLEALDRVRLTCQAAGLTPTRIGLRPYANLLSVRHTKGAPDRRVLFVDIGPGATEIDVMRGDGLAFARSANVNVPLVGAESLARDDSRVMSMAAVSDLEGADEASETAIAELLVETTRTLQAYRATEPDAGVDEIVVAGGTGLETQLADRLQQRLGLPASLFDPTPALRIAASEAPKLRSFSAALGLAWGLSQEPGWALDFLNPKRPVSARETLQRRARIGGLSAAAVLVLVAGVLGQQYYALARQRSTLRKENFKLAKELETRAALSERIEEAEEWAVDAVWPDEWLNVLQPLLEEDELYKKIVVQNITLDAASSVPGITLQNVYAVDEATLAEYVNRLNALSKDGEPLYKASQLTSSEVQNAQKYHRKSDIRVQLRKLLEFREGAPQRAKARKERWKDVLHGAGG